ncbi:MAG: ABC transporter permease [Oscillospiraceae bacterium]|nr:ABC transporter permease [Oscillospiraceae bacterium]
MDELKNKQAEPEVVDTEVPLDKNVRLMSPTRMVVRRFFRSKLSILGLVMVISLFLFSFVGPLFFADTTADYSDDTKWGEIELDESGKTEYAISETTYTVGGAEYTVRQTTEKYLKDNFLATASSEHIMGTDNEGYDIFVRLMYGGRISLTVSFIAVFLITILGVILGGIAGFFGGWIDNLIMRICDVLMCLPGVPILLIISTILDASDIDAKYRIYLLMIYLTFISWTGTARLVRGQILSLREQEYMVAAEAMGYSTSRKIFKHLIPNVMPQLIVQMSLSLGSMILYEATLSYLNLGVKAPYAAWGSMINIISTNQDILQNHLNVWVPAGVCIVIAVLGFNFVGDGLRDALDPKARR